LIPPPGVCDLWVASRSRFDPAHGRLDALLSPAERAHVDRHHREADQRRLRLSRALLRLLLARYLELEPGRIPVERRCPTCARPHGKPRLRGRSGLQFSVAHAGDLLVFAVQAQTPVGVDLEALAGPGGPPPPELVELALTPAERHHLAQVPPAERWRRFLRCWTRKEAALKQLGTGLATPLHDLQVDPTARAGRVLLGGPAGAGAPLWATGFDLGATHLGAVATTGRPPTLRIAELTGPAVGLPVPGV
jgi:4'-phosphopantetheinyl transferase